MDNNNFLAKKFHGRIEIENAWAYYQFHKKGRIQRLLHQMKYHNMPELAELVGRKLGHTLEENHKHMEIDVIIPVPLHKSKMRRRGYNQSEHFANGLAQYLECEVATKSIIRVKDTETQTSKSRVQRWQNVDEIFKVIDELSLKDRHVLLVDDVITTGSTIEACGQSMAKANLKSLSIAAMAAAK
ncbi:ComF family protein [Fulvivirga sp. M361]|uniref:ComF family protein n=1 Tax=Fulvivirga sp. M361 TaxID=2594266 RepID=UPI00162A4149|nr:ComF family protein [Fulvivirga sp. M361]